MLTSDSASDLQAFYAAIRDNPDDDGPLLIFADWLEEQGELEWSELIRVQIELASLAPNDLKRIHLQSRERFLMRSPSASWKPPNHWFDITWGSLEKGVVRTLWVRRLGMLRTRMKQILALAPIHRICLQFVNSGEELADCGQIPELQQIRDLQITHQSRRINWIGAWTLATCPTLKGLRRLNLQNSFIGARGTRAIADSPILSQLRVLELGEVKVGQTGVKAICQSPYLTRLETLNLASNQIGPKGVLWFAGPSRLHSLISLNLAHNSLSDQGVGLLAESPIMAQLRSLDLQFNRIAYNGIAALANSSYVRTLEELDLSSNNFGGPAFGKLASSPHFASLKTLKLGDPRFTLREAAALANSPYFPMLKTLQLFYANWEKSALEVLKHRFGSGLVFTERHPLIR